MDMTTDEPREQAAIVADMGRLGIEAAIRTLLDAKTPEERAAYVATFPRYRYTITERVEQLATLRAIDAETGRPKLTQAEAAAVLGVSESTVRRDETGQMTGVIGAATLDQDPETGQMTARDAALTQEQRDREASNARMVRWSSAWARITSAIAGLEWEAVDGMIAEDRAVERTHATILRMTADKLDAALGSDGVRLVKGGRR
jgi:hypothetical protein